MGKYKEIIYKGIKTISVGALCEVRGRNPFNSEETWKINEIRVDNTGTPWYKLIQVEDIRNTMIISGSEFVVNFIELVGNEDNSN